MKKRIVCLLLLLALCLSLLPTAALATTITKVYIGNVSMGDGSSPRYYTNGAAAATDSVTSGSWNAKLETKDGKLTLTLKDFIYNGGASGIKCEVSDDLYIVLEGTGNSITTDNRGIRTLGNLTISGTSVETSKLAIEARGNNGILTAYEGSSFTSTARTLTIENVTLIATGATDAGIAANESVKITNSNVTASGANYGIQGGCFGTESSGSITFENSTVTACGTGTSGAAIKTNMVIGTYQWRDSRTGGFVKNADQQPTLSESYLELKPTSTTSTTVTVTFHKNCTDATVTAPASTSVTTGGTLTTLPVLTRSGYTFGGWYKDASCTDGNQVNAVTTYSTNTTLYAKWTANSSTPSTGIMTFTNAYDAQRSPANPTVGNTVALRAFGTPFKVSGSAEDKYSTSQGNWSLTPVGTYASYEGKTGNTNDTWLGSIAESIKTAYGLTSKDTVPIYALKLDSSLVVYGVVQAQGKVYDAETSGNETDANGVLFVGATSNTNHSGGTGYFLTSEGSLVSAGNPRWMHVGEDVSGSSAVTITYTNGTAVTAPKVGETLKATVTNPPAGGVTYLWCYDDGATNEEIPTATNSATYTLTAAEQDKLVGVHIYPQGVSSGRPLCRYWFTTRVAAAGASSTDPNPGSFGIVASSGYPITAKKAANGSLSTSPKHAARGDTVTITVTPDQGYRLKTLTILDKNGNEIAFTAKGNGKYTFKMPASRVTVNAAFVAEDSARGFFVDVPANAYFYDAVQWAVKNGITDGVGENTFAPNAGCTRAQIVTFLWRAAGCPEPTALSRFTDVSTDAYYAKAVAWAVEHDITDGVGSDLFAPDVACTRAQAIAFLFRYAAMDGIDVVALQELVSGYTDAAAVPTYARSAFNWALANDVVAGVDRTLLPGYDCTRAQIVTMLYRLSGNN